MSFQAYLDAVEVKTGMTPAQLLDLAHERGFGPTTKAKVVVDWRKADFGVGHGHAPARRSRGAPATTDLSLSAMAFYHLVKNGPGIADKHVGTTGSHRDESTVLRLDGRTNRT